MILRSVLTGNLGTENFGRLALLKMVIQIIQNHTNRIIPASQSNVCLSNYPTLPTLTFLN